MLYNETPRHEQRFNNMLSSLASKYSRTDINSGCRTAIKTIVLFTRERCSGSPAGFLGVSPELTPLGEHEPPLASLLQDNHRSGLARSHRIRRRDVSQRQVSPAAEERGAAFTCGQVQPLKGKLGWGTWQHREVAAPRRGGRQTSKEAQAVRLHRQAHGGREGPGWVSCLFFT